MSSWPDTCSTSSASLAVKVDKDDKDDEDEVDNDELALFSFLGFFGSIASPWHNEPVYKNSISDRDAAALVGPADVKAQKRGEREHGDKGERIRDVGVG